MFVLRRYHDIVVSNALRDLPVFYIVRNGSWVWISVESVESMSCDYSFILILRLDDIVALNSLRKCFLLNNTGVYAQSMFVSRRGVIIHNLREVVSLEWIKRWMPGVLDDHRVISCAWPRLYCITDIRTDRVKYSSSWFRSRIIAVDIARWQMMRRDGGRGTSIGE